MNELPGTPAIQPGEVLGGKFRLGSILGRGGMSVVYEARHVQLGQDVAVKVLGTLQSATRGAFERALREAQASARLTSEHVVRVFDVGTTNTGHAYVVMERLIGVDLAKELRKGQPATAPAAVEIVLQACHGLAEAHASGIVHRDIKPSNLFLATRPDKTVLVKVLDFGLARADSLYAKGEQLSTAPRMAGSPGYASPEQLGTASDVDARADVWGLGIVLYELMTGRRPFEAVNLTEALIAAATLPVPAMQSSLGPVPPDLERIVRRCLEKDRENRFSSVVELADALRPHAPASFAHYPDRIRDVAGRGVPGASQSRITLPDGPSSARGASSEQGSSQGEPNTETGVENPAPLVVAAVVTPHRIALGVGLGAVALAALLFTLMTGGHPTRSSGTSSPATSAGASSTSSTSSAPLAAALGPLAPLPPLTVASSSAVSSAEAVAVADSPESGPATHHVNTPAPARSAAVRGAARVPAPKPAGSAKGPPSNPMTYR